jgi:hypothetical protein
MPMQVVAPPPKFQQWFGNHIRLEIEEYDAQWAVRRDRAPSVRDWERS